MSDRARRELRQACAGFVTTFRDAAEHGGADHRRVLAMSAVTSPASGEAAASQQTSSMEGLGIGRYSEAQGLALEPFDEFVCGIENLFERSATTNASLRRKRPIQYADDAVWLAQNE